jgi:iron-sulfur cluster repair protein YtfE (RIC family)
MNAIDILHQDHLEFSAIFIEMEKTDPKNKEMMDTLFTKLDKIIKTHMESEEKVFYVAAMELEEVRSIVKKSYQSHHFAKVGLTELHLTPYGFDTWKPTLLALKDTVMQHMNEEEELLFPKIQQHFSKEKLERLGLEIVELRN